MWGDVVPDYEILAFQYDGRPMTLDYFYDLAGYYGEDLRDGGFYKIVADVELLNGGVAGYVDYPEIKAVNSVEEVSPFDLGLPSIGESTNGLALIGDYADGDVLLNIYQAKAVWKDGAWAWRYDKQVKLADGRSALVAKGVTEEDAQQGAESGVLANEKYFVLPTGVV